MDINKYLSFLGISNALRNENAAPNLKFLSEIVRRHVMAIPYQNYELFTDHAITELTAEFLQDKMLRPTGNGGVCFQTAQLLYLALKALGYDVLRVMVHVPGTADYDLEKLPTHVVLVVLLHEKKYLVDVGFGYNSTLAPLEFTFDKTEICSVSSKEKYRLSHFADHVTIELWIRDKWCPCYHIPLPLYGVSDDEMVIFYRKMLAHPTSVPNRDDRITASIVREDYRMGLRCDPGLPEPRCTISEIRPDGVSRKIITYAEFCQKIQPYVQKKVSDELPKWWF